MSWKKNDEKRIQDEKRYILDIIIIELGLCYFLIKNEHISKIMH